jgi:hypothetical protein
MTCSEYHRPRAIFFPSSTLRRFSSSTSPLCITCDSISPWTTTPRRTEAYPQAQVLADALGPPGQVLDPGERSQVARVVPAADATKHKSEDEMRTFSRKDLGTELAAERDAPRERTEELVGNGASLLG